MPIFERSKRKCPFNFFAGNNLFGRAVVSYFAADLESALEQFRLIANDLHGALVGEYPLFQETETVRRALIAPITRATGLPYE